MKKAGHCSVPSNPTGECNAIFLASLNDFLLDYVLDMLDAGNLPEKVRPHACPMCEMRKYFLISAFWKLTNMYLNG